MSGTEMKQSSYYVLFLGSKESKGLRGDHYIEPVVQYLVAQEHRMEPVTVTLKVSNKGLRIIPSSPNSFTATENDKHFIPYTAITCVFQAPPPSDDIIATIVMTCNPDTNCNMHVHCYRCDSPETAGILKNQLETLINREENQQKFRDIESRLQSTGLSSTPRGISDFDCPTPDSSENSDRGFGSGSGSATTSLTSVRVPSLYDSLASELRAKLNVRKRNSASAVLLPQSERDYDTMFRTRPLGVESRRCLHPALIGTDGSINNQRTRRSYASREQESCGRFSGVDSIEDNRSASHDQLLGQQLQASSDDEEWNQMPVRPENSNFPVRSALPIPHSAAQLPPPPLPKHPELRHRLPDFVPAHPAGFSREVVETDYRRQLSKESLLRSLNRSTTGSRDSLDRWVENGVRSRGIWEKLNEESHLAQDPKYDPGKFPHRFSPSAIPSNQYTIQKKSRSHDIKRQKEPTPRPSKNLHSSNPDKSYKELGEQVRFPGLDRDTARTLHSSNQNLSQHIYSEPTFDTHRSTHSIDKSKRFFSFPFWK